MTAHGANNATCTEDGNSAYWSCVCGKFFANENATEEIDENSWVIPAGHTYGDLNAAQEEVHTSTELKASVAAHYQCSICNKYFDENQVETTLDALTGEVPTHTYSYGKCSVCQKDFEQPDILASFGFGDNGNASHADGSAPKDPVSFYSGSYTLTASGSKFYTGAYDAKGNSCIKLGTTSETAAFTFTVPEDVTQIIIYAAKYKANASEITINGTTYTLTKNSDDGNYDIIVIDASSVSTVTIATVSGKSRAMINTIEFYNGGEICYHTEYNEATCTTAQICVRCNKELAAMTGHIYDNACDATCNSCGEERTTNHTPGSEATCTTAQICTVCNTELKAALGHTTDNGVCGTCGQTIGGTAPEPDKWELVTNVSDLKAGDKIIIVAKESDIALSTTQNSNNRGQVAITKNGSTIASPLGDDVQILLLESGTVSGTFAFNTGSGYLYAASSSSNYLKTQTTNNANGSWEITIEADGTATITAKGTNTRNVMQYNQTSSLFACYGSASQKAIVIYKFVEGSGNEGGEEPTCEHTNTTETTTATCTAAGTTTVTCDDCKEVISTEETAALGHNYVEGKCSRCGATENAGGGDEVTEKTDTISISGNTGTITSDSSSISWKYNDSTFTNDKGSTAIRTSDSDHYRVYANSTVKIAVSSGKITKVVITCTSSSYAEVMKTSATNSGYTVSVSGSVVTIKVNNATEISFTASAQTRLNKVDVTYLA